MALGDTYITSAELKARLGITNTESDTRIAGAVSAATREVEQFCARQFNDAGSASARKFDSYNRMCFTDDFHTTTGLTVTVVEYTGGGSTISTVLNSTDFVAEPRETIRQGFSVAAPYWRLRNLSSVAWPRGWEQGYLEVTARWGWAAIPQTVKEATYILAEEYYKLKEAPFGVANWGEFGPIRVSENRKVMKMLWGYSRGRIKVS